jgi:hypothetical protein
MRDRKRERKKKREKNEKIKTEIRPSQVQMTITFDSKLRLRRSTRPQKANDEIYRVMAKTSIAKPLRPFFWSKNLILTLKNAFEVFFLLFSIFC